MKGGNKYMTKTASTILMILAGLFGLIGLTVTTAASGIQTLLFSLVLLSYARIAQEWNKKK